MKRKNKQTLEDGEVLIDCDVTLTIKRHLKLKVSDIDIFEDDTDDCYQREIDVSSVDWDEVIDDNDIVPDGWVLEESEVTPVQW